MRLRGKILTQYTRLLHERQGDYLKTIQQCYSDKVEVDEGQKEKLSEISERAKERKIEAAKEYRAALLKIAKKSNTEMKDIFTHQETEAFGEPATSWVP